MIYSMCDQLCEYIRKLVKNVWKFKNFWKFELSREDVLKHFIQMLLHIFLSLNIHEFTFQQGNTKAALNLTLELIELGKNLFTIQGDGM